MYPDFEVNNFQIRAKIHTLISKLFKICQNFHAPRVNEDVIKLRLFSYILRNAASEYLDAEFHGSITTWKKLTKKFCNKFFPLPKSSEDSIENSNIPTERYGEISRGIE